LTDTIISFLCKVVTWQICRILRPQYTCAVCIVCSVSNPQQVESSLEGPPQKGKYTNNPNPT
jgi:hypothetical protein